MAIFYFARRAPKLRYYGDVIHSKIKKSRSRKYNYLIIFIIKNVERASTACACESRNFHVQGADDVWLTLPADSVYENGVVEVSYCMSDGETSI